MVKPQFELRPERVGKGGVVKMPTIAAMRSDRSPPRPRRRGW
jgi:predicted rRNA methylase YqxC with S4 and FtsJ domains